MTLCNMQERCRVDASFAIDSLLLINVDMPNCLRHCQFNFTLYVCAENLHIMNINMLASVGAPPLDTTTVYIVQDFHYYYIHMHNMQLSTLHCVTLDVAISKEGGGSILYFIMCDVRVSGNEANHFKILESSCRSLTLL